MQTGFSVFLAVVLAVILLGQGAGLRPGDVTQLLTKPSRLLAAVFVQVVLLPGLMLVVARAVGTPTSVGVGLVLLAACPAGPLSVVYSGLARAEVAWAMAVTLVSTAVSLVTLPVLLHVALSVFAGEGRLVFGFDKALQVLALVAVPSSVGLWVRARRPVLADRLALAAKRLSAVLLLVAVVAVVVVERGRVLDGLAQVGGLVLFFNLLCLGLGAGVGGALGGRERAAANSLSFAVRNGTIAIATATSPTLLGDASIALPAIVYAGVQTLTSVAATAWWARRGQA